MLFRKGFTSHRTFNDWRNLRSIAIEPLPAIEPPPDPVLILYYVGTVVVITNMKKANKKS